QVSLTLPAFCNFFKQATQMSFTEYLNRYRIDKACLLLLEDISVSECSFRCGFNHVPYFNKTFKKYIHQTPSEFIKQNRRL
ncbi:MAG: helix-turn-helix transcriptional regulator, partial [Flavobacteriaceae bacterium]|nr:helix-turn-helix transcriptional regulator [Candidatus Onthonaster equi]